MSELSHFEAESAKTPKFAPYSILGGAVLLCVAMWLINTFMPTDAVDTMKNSKKAKQEVAAEVAPTPAADADEEDEE